MKRKRDPADIRYSRIAELYDAMDYVSETFYFGKSRKQLLAKVQGKILEVGIGTGQSFKDYPPGQEIVGVDISEKMLGKASEKARARILFFSENTWGMVEIHRKGSYK